MSSNTDIAIDDAAKAENSQDDKESQSKRPRIRFSSIQCQKYIPFEGMDTSHVRGDFGEGEQKDIQKVNADEMISSDVTFPHTSDPEKFISIIHALETKLLATEDKLRILTQNLDVQKSIQTEDLAKIDIMVTEKLACSEQENSTAIKHYTKALELVENSRVKVRAVLSGSHGSTDSQLQSLSEIENDLFSASLHIRQCQNTEKQSPEEQQTPETSSNEALHLFAKKFVF